MKRSLANARRATPVTIMVEDARWRKRKLAPRLRRAASLALERAGSPSDGPVTIVLAGDRKLRELNRTFRGKDKPTNVLSFPALAAAGPELGDIAIAYGVTAREARETGKTFADHTTHLVVHGVLHLLGYDHERAKDARAMETLEIRTLAALGISNPYVLPAKLSAA